MAIRNKSEFRNIVVTFSGGVFHSLDALQAAVERIKVLEAMVERGNAPSDYAGDTIAIVGLNRYKTHIFNLTTVFASGSYDFEFLETVPTVDDSTVLNP